MMMDRNLKILLASSEVAPFAKTGGLADVAGSLPKALATMGNDVRIVMPRYRGITGLETLLDFPVEVAGRRETAIVRQGFIEARFQDIHRRVPVYFIDNYHYFDREGLYRFPDEAERFAFFCRAVLEMLPRLPFQPDIIHCNDWQTGPIPLLLKVRYGGEPFYRRLASVFTIHNLQYQGNFPRESLRLLGLGDEYYHPESLEFYGMVSFIKAGILYADVINTVSNRYAREIQTPERGERLDGLLRKRSRDLYGIVNGINIHEFNPRTDPRIYKHYGPENLQDKKENKYALQKEVGLPVRDVPLLGMVSRLADQKGLDLVAAALEDLLALDLQMVLLGTGEPYYENLFREIQRRYPRKMYAYIGFNGILAQRIYAGADMFLMPSRFEPCGLGQLISLRYGTIPIVRATGGLADTVIDFDSRTGMGNGFSFEEYSARHLVETVHRALRVYENPEQWQHLMLTALSQDFSWARSAAEYMELYDEALGKHVALARSVEGV